VTGRISGVANWFAILEYKSTEIFHIVPDLKTPSCRYLPSRVLTLLNYDAYWLRQA